LGTLDEDIENVLNGNHSNGKPPEFWDGKTGERIVEVLLQQMQA